MLSIGPKFIGIFLFLFSALVRFRFFMEIIYASSYQILQIQYKDMKLGGPQHILFCVCVNCYDLRLYILFKLAKSCKETWLSFVCALPFGTILNRFQKILKREEKKITRNFQPNFIEKFNEIYLQKTSWNFESLKMFNIEYIYIYIICWKAYIYIYIYCQIVLKKILFGGK